MGGRRAVRLGLPRAAASRSCGGAYSQTGGWAAGLQLFHLATVGRSASERHQAVADLGGRSKLARSYLTRNVLAELPEERREFLLRTCTLGRLSGEACDALLGTRGSHLILEELENAQLFTFTDDGGMTSVTRSAADTSGAGAGRGYGPAKPASGTGRALVSWSRWMKRSPHVLTRRRGTGCRCRDW